jgi:hypothetical protein
MKRAIASLTIGACLLVPSAGMGQTVTKTPPSHQPGTNSNVNCNTSTGPNTPGNAATMSQGAPFSPTGTAGGVYANAFNNGGSSLNSHNLSATSQYDIACAQVP